MKGIFYIFRIKSSLGIITVYDSHEPVMIFRVEYFLHGPQSHEIHYEGCGLRHYGL